MRVGIVGGGFGLDVHLPAFVAVGGVAVTALADSGSGRVRGRLPAGVTYASSWRELLAMDIDTVSVAVPPARQQEIVLAALAQGKHVFCEKPFGATLAEAEGMANGARRAPDNVVAVNFQFRYERGIALLKEKICAGAIGNLRAIDVSWLTGGRASPESPWSWRNDASAGGGVMGAFFSHIADLFCWLSAAEPKSVSGQTRILVAERTDDTGRVQAVTAEDAVSAHVEMTDGVVATCRITNCQPGGNGMRIEARGDRGMLTYRHLPPFAPAGQSLELRTRDVVTPIPLSEVTPSQADSRMRAVHRCVADFAARAAGDAHAQPPTVADGLRVQRIMDALRQSAAAGRAFLVAEHA